MSWQGRPGRAELLLHTRVSALGYYATDGLVESEAFVIGRPIICCRVYYLQREI